MLTAIRGDSRESATENRPPPAGVVRVKRCGKSAPALRVTGVARQTPREARPRRPQRELRLRGRSRAARPSSRVGRSRHPATVCPDGWSPPRHRTRWCGTESGLEANSSAPIRRPVGSARRGASRPQRVCSRSEHRVDSVPRPVVVVGPQVRVGVQRLDGASVTETSLNRLHASPVPDEQARVVVPQCVETRAVRQSRCPGSASAPQLG